MLNADRNMVIQKRLTAWLCYLVDQSMENPYLCLHCANYLALDVDATHQPSIPDGSDLYGKINESRLKIAILCLLPDQRAVVYLKIGLGLSNQDIADYLCISPGAVKAIHRRALIILLHLLDLDE